MAENKTKPTKASVTEFMNSIEDPQKRADARKVAAMMRKATGKRARMWGPSIVGFGTYHRLRSPRRNRNWNNNARHNTQLTTGYTYPMRVQRRFTTMRSRRRNPDSDIHFGSLELG